MNRDVAIAQLRQYSFVANLGSSVSPLNHFEANPILFIFNTYSSMSKR